MATNMRPHHTAPVISVRFTKDEARLLTTTPKRATIWDANERRASLHLRSCGESAS